MPNTKPTYIKFNFDPKYKDETVDKRYARLCREFNASHTQKVVELYASAKDTDENTALLNIYQRKIAKLGVLISYFQQQKLKKDSTNDLLTIGGYPAIEFLNELLARANECIKNPGDIQNQRELINLANQIPPDTQGYWRDIKIGITMFLAIALSVSLVMAAAILIPTPLAPIATLAICLGLTLAATVPLIGGAYIAGLESKEIERTTGAQEIKKMITKDKQGFFSSPLSKESLKDDTEQKQRRHSI